MEKEKYLATYKCFDILLPANMGEIKPYIWLKGNGKYYIEMGDTQMGNLMRIDNFLEALGERVENLRLGLAKYEEREQEIKAELARNENYTDKIEELRKKVASIDNELGVSEE